MWVILNLTILFTLVEISLTDGNYAINNKKFPKNFMFGVATSAYQIEGAWNKDGKGPSIWDNFTHADPGKITDGSNADVACDSYHKYKEDIALLKDLGLNHYRFSISWNRIFTNGLPEEINSKGIEHYKSLVKELKANGIEPLVTLYHWDLPQALQDRGGLLNDSFSKWFADYSRVVFQSLGEDVTYWITFNEPVAACLGYGNTSWAPGVGLSGVGEYLCMHNLIKGHAAAYHVLKDELKQNGKVSMAFSLSYFEPLTNSTEDIQASEQQMQFGMGWIANPLYYGDYPEIMKTRIANRSAAEGFNSSRLPEFTEEEKNFNKNTSDFIGVNVYHGGITYAIDEPEIVWPPTTANDIGVGTITPDGDPTFSMTDLLRWIRDHYDNPDMIVTENGFGIESGDLEDDARITVVQNSLSRFLDAIDDGINVFGYTLWSLLDNYEWVFGYTRKFGIYQIDFNSPNRTRTPRKSATWYKQVVLTHCITDNCIE